MLAHQRKVKRKAQNYVVAANHDVLDRLRRLVDTVLYAKRMHEKPKVLSKTLESMFATGEYADLNPLTNVDSYGVEQLLALGAREDEIKQIKSYYKAAIDYMIRKKSGYDKRYAREKALAPKTLLPKYQSHLLESLDENFIKSLHETYYADNKPAETLILFHEEENDNNIESTPAATLPFDLGEFKGLETIEQRLNYAKERLKRVGTGSARVVFDLNFPNDIRKAIKIAKNLKGLIQNKQECDVSDKAAPEQKTLLSQIIACDEAGSWIEVEKAIKFNQKMFQTLMGFDFSFLEDAMEIYFFFKKNYQIDVTDPGSLGNKQKTLVNDYFNRNYKKYEAGYKIEVISRVFSTTFFKDLIKLLSDFDMPYGDILEPSSWGFVKRGDKYRPVLVDYGLNNAIFSSYYSRTLKY